MKRIDIILVLISILTLAAIASAFTLKTVSASGYAGPYYTVESATNSSTIVMGPAPAVNQTFTVAIKLYNVTTSDVTAGIAGVEVHLTWNNTLIQPVSYVDEEGQPGGVLTGPTVLPGLGPGFFDSAGIKIPAPYTNATHFEVASASSSGPWWGNGAEVATITFNVTSQPQPFGTCPLWLDFTDLVDASGSSVAHGDNTNVVANATYTILTPTPETVTFQGVPYQLSIVSDSQITVPTNMGFQNYTDGSASLTFNVTSTDTSTYGCNVTVPNNFMWSIPTNNWTITVDSSIVSPSITYDSANAYLWFNFTAGNHVIMLTSTNVVPEFAAMSLILFLMATTLIVTTAATVLRRRKLHR